MEAGRKEGFKIICFIAPTTTSDRMELIVKKSQGFLYYISVVGITGVRSELPADITENIQNIKRSTSLPVAMGFGISTPEQARAAGKIADGVIVGSAIMREIEKFSNQDDKILINNVGKFVCELVKSAKNQN